MWRVPTGPDLLCRINGARLHQGLPPLPRLPEHVLERSGLLYVFHDGREAGTADVYCGKALHWLGNRKVCPLVQNNRLGNYRTADTVRKIAECVAEGFAVPGQVLNVENKGNGAARVRVLYNTGCCVEDHDGLAGAQDCAGCSRLVAGA